MKPVAGDGPGNRLRRLRISNSTRRRRTLALRPADAAHAIGRSADQLHLPGRQTIDLSDHLPASLIDRALRIGVAVFGDSTFRRTFSRVAFTSKSPGSSMTAGASAATSEGKWPGRATPSWTDDIVALIAPQASWRRTSRSGNFSASTANSKLARLSALTKLQATRQTKRAPRKESKAYSGAIRESAQL